MDDEVKGVPGSSLNYTFRMHDPRVGRFFAVDPLLKKYPWNSPYAFSENKLIAYRELEGLESFYSAGAGHDPDNIGYIKLTQDVFLKNKINLIDINSHSNSSPEDAMWAGTSKERWTPYYDIVDIEVVKKGGISGDPTLGAAGLGLGRETRAVPRKPDWRITTAFNQMVCQLSSVEVANSDNLQLNLIGYSTGSVIVAQVALMLAENGYRIDNLVLVGTTILENSELYNTLLENPKIGKVIRDDIPGDNVLEGTSAAFSFILKGDAHPHFKYAFHEDAETNIQILVDKLLEEGIEPNIEEDDKGAVKN